MLKLYFKNLLWPILNVTLSAIIVIKTMEIQKYMGDDIMLIILLVSIPGMIIINNKAVKEKKAYKEIRERETFKA